MNRGTDRFTLRVWHTSQMFACLSASVLKLNKRTVFRIEVAEVVLYFLSYASRDVDFQFYRRHRPKLHSSSCVAWGGFPTDHLQDPPCQLFEPMVNVNADF